MLLTMPLTRILVDGSTEFRGLIQNSTEYGIDALSQRECLAPVSTTPELVVSGDCVVTESDKGAAKCVGSPGFPIAYGSAGSTACIIKARGVGLLFTRVFNVFKSEACAEDYLEIQGQRFCGILG